MGNVLRVFWRDVKRIAKVPPAWLVVLFLVVLPSLYTWFNVAGFWNPYENTGAMRVCVVNEDAGASDEMLGDIKLGDQVVDELKGNDQLGWQFMSRDEAMEEVESGRAYAAFVIPEDFSADVTTLLSGDFEQPQLEYYVNEKAGPVAPKITDTGATTLDTTINDTFVSTASSAVASAIDETLGKAQVDLDDTRNGVALRLEQAQGDIADARTSLSDLAAAADAAVGKADAAKDALDDAKAQIVLLSTGLSQASELAADANTGIVAFSGSMGSVLDHGSVLLSQASSKADAAIGQTAGSIVAATGSVDAALNGAQAVVDENARLIALLRGIEQGIPDDGPGKGALDAAISSREERNAEAQGVLDGLGELSRGTADAAASVAGAADATDEAVQQTLGSIDGYRQTLGDEVIPKASDGLARVVTATTGFGSAVSNQTLLVDQGIGVIDQLQTTLSLSVDALSQIDSLLADLQTDFETVKTDVAALGSSSALGSLIDEGNLNPDKVADFMMSPTQVETVELYPLNSYGSAMAPLFINLTLWIGVFMLMVIMRIEVDDEGIENLTIAQRFLGRGLLLAVMVTLQAIVCCAGCLVIGVQAVNVPAFFLTAVICSLAYLAIQYSLSTALQHVGKAICVILVFVQIPGATGLYPIEMTPSFFQAVYPLFPFTYGINAIRETTCGFYDGAWLHAMGVLVAFAAVFLLIGVLVRPYLTNLNRLFARQIEESDIINGEAVQLPERRYRMAQLIRVLSDREEYRSAIAARAGRFMRLYPKFKRGAVVAGILIPAVVTLVFAITATEKVVMLTAWVVLLVGIVAFLIVVEYVRDSLNRQVKLEAMSDEEVRTLYARRNAVASSCARAASVPTAERAGQAGWCCRADEAPNACGDNECDGKSCEEGGRR
ncbi:MAG: YhgE/Pip domain-containing protein [Slackia sp.]|nr:YhgE/Pip domain-containing protein [Slackia sp.]